MTFEYPEQWLEGMNTGERVAAELRLHIVKGTIKPGTLLTENKIATQFGVSRSPVRDAFKLLKQDQLIRLARMGAEVCAFGECAKRELYDIRIMLESFAFTRIDEATLPTVVQSLRKQLEMMEVAVKYNDAEAFTTHDIAFHEVLVHASQHAYLNMFWNSLKPVMRVLILLSMRERMAEQPDDFERIHQNHEDFIQAIEMNDRSQLKSAFHKNFNDVGDQIDRFWL